MRSIGISGSTKSRFKYKHRFNRTMLGACLGVVLEYCSEKEETWTSLFPNQIPCIPAFHVWICSLCCISTCNFMCPPWPKMHDASLDCRHNNWTQVACLCLQSTVWTAVLWSALWSSRGTVHPTATRLRSDWPPTDAVLCLLGKKWTKMFPKSMYRSSLLVLKNQ